MRPLRSLSLALLVTLIAGTVIRGSPPAPVMFSPWTAWWDQTRGLHALQQHPGVATSVSPYWYVFGPDGTLRPLPNADDPEFVATVRALGIPLLPTISNAHPQTNHKDPALAASVLGDPERRARHVAAIHDTVRARGYDGIDINYENMAADLRGAFTVFIRDLADLLHAEGRLLAVTLQPKTGEPGGGNGSAALDYAAIGAVADLVRVMAYDYSWETSGPGPVAPLPWVEQVVRYAAAQIPPARLQLGVALYGYEWAAGAGTSRMWDELDAIAREHGAEIRWDPQARSPWFEYDADGRRVVVWFEDADSLAYKLDLVRRFGLAGLAAWRLGGEDPRVWQLLSEAVLGAPDATASTSASPRLRRPWQAPQRRRAGN